MKKTISIILSALMVLSCLSVLSLCAFAQDVDEIIIKNNKFSLGIGESHTVIAEVTGDADDKSVTWSISGNVSAETTIDADGLLTIGIDETADTLKVRATANADDSAYAELEVRVLQYTAAVTGVKINNVPEGVKQRSSYQFYSSILGTQSDTSRTYELTGNNSENTTLDQNGKLYVAKDETAKTLTVKITSCFDPTKFAEATFAVLPYTEVSEFNAEINYAKILLTADHTEGEVEKMIEENSKINIEGSKGHQSGLYYMLESMNGIKDGSEQVNTERNYYLSLYCELPDGYAWVDEVTETEDHIPLSDFETFKIVINGKEIKEALVRYNSYWNGIRVFVPIGPATEHDPQPEPIVFPDVKEGSWYYDMVQYCAQRGYMGGYSNGNFGPADNLKRQDFVLILAKIADANLDKYADTASKFSDVKKGSYYYSAVMWAVENGIIGGYSNGKFGVGDNITREQVATILYRYMGSPDVSNVDTTLAKFSDVNRISAYAKIPIAWAVQKEVISGMADGRVAPIEGASRAQIATIVMRMDQQGMFDPV